MKKLLNKKIMSVIALLILIIGLSSVSLLKVNASTIGVTSIRLNKAKDTLTTNKTDILKATILPIKATNKGVTWKSSNTKVAKVDKFGRVTAVRAGHATITATTANGGKRATCVVTVTNLIRVKSVRLNKTKNTLMVNKTDNLKTILSPTNATNKGVTWKSSNTKIAKVDRVGKVTTVSEGKATITATTSDGNRRSTCIITVTKPIPKTVTKTIYNGSSIKQKVRTLEGVFDINGGLSLNKYGSIGASQFTYFDFNVCSGSRDMNFTIMGSNPEVDKKIKTILNMILPTKGNTLYSILDNVNLKSQTLRMDGRIVKIDVEKAFIGINFGPTIK